MPHCIIEHSKSLTTTLPMPAMMDKIFTIMNETKIQPRILDTCLIKLICDNSFGSFTFLLFYFNPPFTFFL